MSSLEDRLGKFASKTTGAANSSQVGRARMRQQYNKTASQAVMRER